MRMRIRESFPGSGILNGKKSDPGSGMEKFGSGNRDKHLGSATLFASILLLALPLLLAFLSLLASFEFLMFSLLFSSQVRYCWCPWCFVGVHTFLLLLSSLLFLVTLPTCPGSVLRTEQYCSMRHIRLTPAIGLLFFLMSDDRNIDYRTTKVEKLSDHPISD
jgi:hypothetical protein